MRMRLAALAFVIATPVAAETVVAPAPVIAATVYPVAAQVVRRAVVELPEGRHTLHVPAPADGGGRLPDIAAFEGVTIGAVTLLRSLDVVREDLFTDAERAAFAAVEAAEDRVRAAEVRLGAAEAAVAALDAERVYFSAIRPPSEDALDPARFRETAALVKTELARVLAEIETASATLEEQSEDLEALQETLAEAERTFERLRPPGDIADIIAVDVDAAAAGEAVFEMTYLTPFAGWALDYDMRLSTETSEVVIDRKARVVQQGESYWGDVRLTLSTARPAEQVRPMMPDPNRAMILEPALRGRSADVSMSPAREEMAMAEPAIMIEDDARLSALATIERAAVTYEFPTPVTLDGEGSVLLSLDTLAYPVETAIHASPRHDDTAFMVATLANVGAEPILPGDATFHRDGQIMGRDTVELIPAGGEALLPFGPIDGIRLKRTLVRNETGDAGLISRSNTRDQRITFSVENLTAEPQSVRAFYPLPFAEEEDLSIRISVVPRPDETNIEDERGVSAWNLELAPGETQSVRIDVALSWPEGQELIWTP